jgi:hypothetical protein
VNLPPSLKINSLLQLQEILDKGYHPDLLDSLKEDPKEAIRQITELPTEDAYKKYPVQTVQQLKEALQEDTGLADLLRYDPAAFMQKMVKETVPPQYKIYRILIGSLCAALLIIIAGVITAWFTKNSREAPTLLTAVACTTLGMLAGMFVNIPGKSYIPAQGPNSK